MCSICSAGISTDSLSGASSSDPLIARHASRHRHAIYICNKGLLIICLFCRFQHSQFVEGDPHVRFYAGAPLVSSEGYVMGSLGILDLVPRK